MVPGIGKLPIFVMLCWVQLHVVSNLATTSDEGNTVSEDLPHIQYHPGELNLVLISPHGGALKPDTIPDRPKTGGCWEDSRCVYRHAQCTGTIDPHKCHVTIESDYKTRDLTLRVADAVEELTGQKPHLVINNLKRTKLDPNREINLAAYGIPSAEEAWMKYHGSVNRSVASFQGPGLVLDMHGQSHKIVRTEFGYNIKGKDLDNGTLDADISSIRGLAARTNMEFSQLIHGPHSMGGYLEAEGFYAVPSPTYPGPGGELYFYGGFSIGYHGSADGGEVDAIMIESSIKYRTADVRPIYAKALARAIVRYMNKYYNVKIANEKLLNSPGKYSDLLNNTHIWGPSWTLAVTAICLMKIMTAL